MKDPYDDYPAAMKCLMQKAVSVWSWHKIALLAKEEADFDIAVEKISAFVAEGNSDFTLGDCAEDPVLFHDVYQCLKNFKMSRWAMLHSLPYVIDLKGREGADFFLEKILSRKLNIYQIAKAFGLKKDIASEHGKEIARQLSCRIFQENAFEDWDFESTVDCVNRIHEHVSLDEYPELHEMFALHLIDLVYQEICHKPPDVAQESVEWVIKMFEVYPVFERYLDEDGRRLLQEYTEEYT